MTTAPSATPLKRMTEATLTDYWNDSCAVEELTYAVERGAVGATSNPTIVLDLGDVSENGVAMMGSAKATGAEPGAGMLKVIVFHSGARCLTRATRMSSPSRAIAEGRSGRGAGLRPAGGDGAGRADLLRRIRHGLLRGNRAAL